MAYLHISLPQAFAHGDPKECFKRFEICCRANAWDDDAKAAKLPTLLAGEALTVWLELEEAGHPFAFHHRMKFLICALTFTGLIFLGLSTFTYFALLSLQVQDPA